MSFEEFCSPVTVEGEGSRGGSVARPVRQYRDRGIFGGTRHLMRVYGGSEYVALWYVFVEGRLILCVHWQACPVLTRY